MPEADERSDRLARLQRIRREFVSPGQRMRRNAAMPYPRHKVRGARPDNSARLLIQGCRSYAYWIY